MRSLFDDQQEMSTDAQRAWVARMRRRYGIRPKEGATWIVEAYCDRIARPDGSSFSDSATVDIQTSPGDALASAECRTSYAARRNGIGSWTMEVFGDGENAPRMMHVRPVFDDDYYKGEQA